MTNFNDMILYEMIKQSFPDVLEAHQKTLNKYTNEELERDLKIYNQAIETLEGKIKIAKQKMFSGKKIDDLSFRLMLYNDKREEIKKSFYKFEGKNILMEDVSSLSEEAQLYHQDMLEWYAQKLASKILGGN